MNYRSIGLVTAAVLGWAAATVSAGAQEFKWNFANAYPPSEFHSRAMTKFAEDMKAKTNGALDITVHHSGSLFPNTEIVQATRTGLVEMGSQLIGNLSRENRIYEIDSIPFLVNSYADAKLLWEEARGPIGDALRESGLRLVYLAPWPSQGFFFKKEINSLGDVKGLAMRAYNPMTTRLAELMGATPATVQMTETAQALATGMIQAVHTAPNSGALYELNQYTTNYYKTDAWIPYHAFFIREEAFQQLPADVQEQALQLGKELEEWSWGESEAAVAAGEKTLAERGMIVAPPGEQLAKELNEVGQKLLEEWLAVAGETAAPVIEAYNSKRASK